MNPSTGQFEAMPDDVVLKGPGAALKKLETASLLAAIGASAPDPEAQAAFDRRLRKTVGTEGKPESPLLTLLDAKGAEDICTPEEIAATGVDIPQSMWAIFDKGRRFELNHCVYEITEVEIGTGCMGVEFRGYSRKWLKQAIKEIRYQRKLQARSE